MCGILISKTGEESVLNSIETRGIESKVIDLSGVYLCHHRLPIQTLQGDSWEQPLETSDGIFLLFNGEIFNYDTSRFGSDTEYLKNLFSGISSLDLQFFCSFYLPHIQEWDGFWAIVLYDSRNGDVLCFTDPLGRKCLYYNENGEICSEIKGVLRENHVFDESYFSSVKKWGYNKDERTPYLGIKKLRNNTIVHYNLESPQFFYEYRDYYNSWNYPIKELVGASYDEHMTWLWDKMFESVRNRLISKKYEISSLVSGGLDSSIIASILKEMDQKVHFFSIENGETEFVDLLGMHLDSQIDFLTYSMEDSKNSEIYKKWNETPVDLGSVIPQYHLFKAVKDCTDYRIVISGDGADELFGGYNRINEYDSQGSDIFEELTYYHLPRLDKTSMANTLELRCPFLNLDIVRFAIHLPIEWRKNKKILKDTFSPLLPVEIVNREKVPLKNPEIKRDKVQYRNKAIDLFRG